MAERGRFELPEPVKVQRFSRPPQSTTLPPLRDESSLTWRETATVFRQTIDLTSVIYAMLHAA
jgi:hypothetical protein